MKDQFVFGQVRRVCPSCGYIHFRDPKVAAVIFIREDDHVLLVKRSLPPEQGKWALPAGYVNAGEDPAQAAIRETEEETGLKVEIVGLRDVVFNPPRPGYLFLGATIAIIYEARVIGGKLCAQDDVDDVDWFTHDNLPEIAFASTTKAIYHWLAEE
ncbi:MAG: NUDIX hydrolase [Chloroflexi bacterium]|nr:NUDIX hydrolase [Chloroflexota bacterium]